MKARDLKNSILQMAVQGKLVPQDSNDEPATKLLERIREERAELVRQKKVKDPKGGESVIYRNGESWFERRGNAEPVCIDDEIPFNIPESWEWARLSSLIALMSGVDLSPSDYNDANRGIPYLTGASNFSNGALIENRWTEKAKRISKRGELLFTCKGTVGEMAINTFGEAHIARQIMAIGPTDPKTLGYIQVFLSSMVASIKAAAKGVIPGIERGTLLDALIPIPPLTEQQRIVAKIDKLLPLVEEYRALEAERETLDVELPDRLRKSVLQMAVEGKLVPQNPSDEPASVLMEHIREERAELIKQKKIKPPKGGESVIFRDGDSWYERRGNADPVCIDDEIPFDIPCSWEWARLDSLGEIIGGGTPKTGDSSLWADGDEGYPWLTPADMKNIKGLYASRGERNISEKGLNSSSARLMPVGTVLMSSRAPIGYLAIAANAISTNQGFKSVVPQVLDTNLWICKAIEARLDDIQRRATGTTFKEVSGSEFGLTVIPIPPLTEQRRIVERIDGLKLLVEVLSQ